VWKIAGSVFLQIPFEYGFVGVVGKRYEAIKDFLKWNNFKVKEWLPIFVRAGEIWASNIEKKKPK